MNQALYFCTSECEEDDYFHYGLATPYYTHFTSPIRRYADVLVHRLLAASIDLYSLPNFMTDRAKVIYLYIYIYIGIQTMFAYEQKEQTGTIC